MDVRWTSISAPMAKAYGLNPLLVQAIIQVESGGDTYAVRYEPGWRYLYEVDKFSKLSLITFETEQVMQSMSWGLMQVMGSVARELGHGTSLGKLFEPHVGIDFGCRQLHRLSARYSKMEDIASAYNAGSVRKNQLGLYSNQDYVNKVMRLVSA